MIEQQIISFFVSKRLKELWPNFVKLIDNDEGFKNYLLTIRNKDGTISKNVSKGKDSKRIEYSILKMMKIMMNEQNTKSNNLNDAQTEIDD